MTTESVRAAGGTVDSIFRTADVVGDGWSWLVIREVVLHGVGRFGELRARLGAARSTLSARLYRLTAGGLLTPVSDAGGGRYEPTAAGGDFFGCLMVAMRWGERWYFDDETRPLTFVHVWCAQPVDAVLSCAECHDPLLPYDVAAERGGSFAGVAARHGATRRRRPALELLERERTCAIARTQAVIGDWWSSLVIREVFFGTRRFEDFQRRLDIAPNILAGRLRRLVEHGVLAKVRYDDWPVRDEYRLTRKGLDLYHVPLAMHAWGRRWLEPIASDTILTHRPCSADVDAVLTCGSCGEPITRKDVSLTPAER